MSFNRDFDKRFAKTEKTIKRFGIFTVFFALIQVIFGLAIMLGIVYFIAFAVTHWLKW